MERTIELERVLIDLDNAIVKLINLGIFPDFNVAKNSSINNIYKEIIQELKGE